MKRRPWTEKEEERLLALREQWIHSEEIAAIIGRTDQAIRLKLHALGFSSANPPRCRAISPERKVPEEQIVAIPQPPTAEVGPLPEQEITIVPSRPDPDDYSDLRREIRDDFALARDALAHGEIRQMRQRYEELLRTRSFEERCLELWSSRLETFAPSAAALVPREPRIVATDEKREAAVLLLSDLHIGQNVSAEETGGFGDYNVRRYCERLAYLESRTVQLLKERSASTGELVVFLLGDIVHGVLQHGAEREQTLLLADQFQLALWTLHQLFCRLAAVVPRLRVHCVVGNHGRLPNQRRMPTVGRYSNLDYLVYSALEQSLRAQGLEQVEFQLNAAPRQTVTIKGARFHASHGDHLRGGDKQLAIPLGAIAREVNVTAQRHAAASVAPIDYFVVGDKHKSASLPLATGSYILNGSFVGADEFSSFNFPPSAPVQLLFWVSPRLGKTWQYDLKLQFAPELADLPYELPNRIGALVEQYRRPGREAA